MITPLATPAAGKILLDANNTVIKVQSDNGTGHFFRGVIDIDGTEFDRQGWSRTDEFTATKDLKNLYKAYFVPVFNETFTNKLELQTHLMRDVVIKIEEYDIETGGLVQTAFLPGFKIMHNITPVAFDDTEKIRFLDFDMGAMVVPANGKIAFPFFVNADTEDVGVTLSTNFGTVLDAPLRPVQKGKQVWLYQFDLSGVALSYETLFLTAVANCGTHTVNKTFRINRLPNFTPKEIAFRNNFGFYLYAYLDGALEIAGEMAVQTYNAADGNAYIFEVDESATYTISSGSMQAHERAVLNMIARSLDTRLRNGSEWLYLYSNTKKLSEFKDRRHVYSDDLIFKLQRNTNVANVGLIEGTPSVPDIEIDDYSVTGNAITVHFHFNNGFTASQAQIQIRASGAAAWITLSSNAASPKTISFTPGVWQFRVIQFGNPLNASDIITFTI